MIPHTRELCYENNIFRKKSSPLVLRIAPLSNHAPGENDTLLHDSSYVRASAKSLTKKLSKWIVNKVLSTFWTSYRHKKVPHVKVTCGVNNFPSQNVDLWLHLPIFPQQSINFLKGLPLKNIFIIIKKAQFRILGKRCENWQNKDTFFNRPPYTQKCSNTPEFCLTWS